MSVFITDFKNCAKGILLSGVFDCSLIDLFSIRNERKRSSPTESKVMSDSIEKELTESRLRLLNLLA